MQSTVWKIGAATNDMPIVVPLMYLEHVYPIFIPFSSVPVKERSDSIPEHEYVWKNDCYTRRY